MLAAPPPPDQHRMRFRLIALLASAALLGACANPGSGSGSGPRQAAWNGGIWNSVLGYHGTANATAMPGGPQ
jgi:hypothetical protein